MKYLFFNDYSEGAHPKILQALLETNQTQEAGYGLDSVSLDARELIRAHTGSQEHDVHFVSGGTQANLLVLGALLKPHEGVISAESGHINVHEAGAIEATGHKIIPVKAKDGKLTPTDIARGLESHDSEHCVKPRVVFISQATELGTVYTKAELVAISDFCKANELLLYLDGARLGSALASAPGELSIADIARLVDVFYIGGTKNGALIGEAIVITNAALKTDFRYHLKFRGALLAKGRVLGAQFRELFTNGLYLELAKHACAMAARLSQGIGQLGYKFQTDSRTNQIFPIFPNSIVEKLRENYGFYQWAKIDENNVCVRLVTSWATKSEAVESFLSDLKSIS